MEEYPTNGETSGAPMIDIGLETKTEVNISPKIIDDKRQSNMQELLLKMRKQCKAKEVDASKKKAKETQNIDKNSQNSTIIKIRIPPHIPKKPKKRFFEEEEEGNLESIAFSSKSHFRTNHFNTRPTTPVNKFQIPKRVLTPDWDKVLANEKPKKVEEEQNSSNNEDENENEKLWRTFDQNERHRRLEIYENRIIWGLNNEYQHPAQSIKAAADGMLYVLSKEEFEKSNRYEQIPCKHVVPKFWEPRVWDKTEDLLDEKKSEELQASIEAASTPKLTHPATPHSHASKKQLLKRSLSVNIGSTKRGRPRRGMDSSLLMLPIGNFETDSDNERSDWEDHL